MENIEHPFRISRKEFWRILLLAALLIGVYLVKLCSMRFLLTSDASNEPLILLSKRFAANFQNDDFYKYQPYSYIPAHKWLLSLLWSNPVYASARYYTWFCLVIIFTLFAYFLLFRFFSKHFWISAAMAVGVIVGVFSNYWAFSYTGLSDFDSLIARTNFNVLIPLLLLFFAWSLKKKQLVFWFFLTLGLCVNLYPAIAINSAFAFYIVFFLMVRGARKPVYLVGVLALFMIGAAPFVYMSMREMSQLSAVQIADPMFQSLLEKTKALSVSESVENSLGTARGLVENFILYPPFLILFSFLLLARRKYQNCESADRNIPAAMTALFIATVILMLIGWAMQHFNYNFPGSFAMLPRLQYLGNFMIVLGYIHIAIYLGALAGEEAGQVSFAKTAIVLFTAIALVFMVLGVIGFNGRIIFPGAGPWLLATALVLVARVLYKGRREAKHLIIVIVLLALAGGFSYSYDESVDYLRSPFRQVHRGLLIGSATLLFAGAAFFYLRKKAIHPAWLFLTLVPFSWALIPRVWNNAVAVLSPTDAQQQQLKRVDAFLALADWTRANTPITARFFLTEDQWNGWRAINVFKTVALRSTPLLRGGEYFYYGKEGYNYASAMANRFTGILSDKSAAAEGMRQLSDEIGFDYFILDKAFYPRREFADAKKVYENSIFTLYRITRANKI